ncbi:hypothetical protein H8959_019908 [Pygathrix nigripes]
MAGGLALHGASTLTSLSAPCSGTNDSGMSSPSSPLREQSFLCAAGDTGEQSRVQVLKNEVRRGSLVLLGWVEQAYTNKCACGPSAPPAPTPPSLSQRVMCNDLFN